MLAIVAAGCSSKPPMAPIERGHVAKHFVVVVEEPDAEDERAGAMLTRPVASGPLSNAKENEKAFASQDPRYAVFVAWRGECLDVTVARRGKAPFDDFEAHGCVKPESPTTTVASVVGASGAPIDVLVWVLET